MRWLLGLLRRMPWRENEKERPMLAPKTEGQKAHAQASSDLADAEARWPEVRRVAGSLRDLRARNNFGTQVALIFRNEDQ